MKFLTDENIFVPIVNKLREKGHDVYDIKEQNLSGIADSEIFKMSSAQNRVLITMDKDFSSILKYPIGTHPGIIILKLYRLSVPETANIFFQHFENISEKDIPGNIIIIDRSKTRIRRII